MTRRSAWADGERFTKCPRLVLDGTSQAASPPAASPPLAGQAAAVEGFPVVEPTASHFQKAVNAATTAHVHQVGEGVGRSRGLSGALCLPLTDLAEGARAILGVE